MVKNATDYKYSSSRHHTGLTNDKLITNHDIGVKQDEYEDYLKSMLNNQYTEVLKRNTHKGLPCGSDGFIQKLGNKIGKDLSFRGVGRPKKG